MSVALRTLFVQLKTLFKLHESRLLLVRDDHEKYLLDAGPTAASGGRRTPFGGVVLTPAHVGLHLGALSLYPALNDELSPGLRRRMRGRASFEFNNLDDVLVEDLAALLGRSLLLYQADGRLAAPHG